MKTIYIRLMNEGTDVFRPTLAEVVKEGIFKILPTTNYNADDECWEFVPGSVVKCVSRKLDGCDVLVAVAID